MSTYRSSEKCANAVNILKDDDIAVSFHSIRNILYFFLYSFIILCPWSDLLPTQVTKTKKVSKHLSNSTTQPHPGIPPPSLLPFFLLLSLQGAALLTAAPRDASTSTGITAQGHRPHAPSHRCETVAEGLFSAWYWAPRCFCHLSVCSYSSPAEQRIVTGGCRSWSAQSDLEDNKMKLAVLLLLLCPLSLADIPGKMCCSEYLF